MIETEKYSNGCGQYLNESVRRSGAHIDCELLPLCAHWSWQGSQRSVTQRDRNKERRPVNQETLKGSSS